MEEQDLINELKKLQEQLSTPSLSYQIITHPGYQLVNRIMSNPACILVFAYYPKFKKDIVKLLLLECIIEADNKLEWKKSKQFLAEYFGSQRDSDEQNRWEIIENLFIIKGQKVDELKDSYKNARKKPSEDFDVFHEILEVKAPNPPKRG